MGTCVLNWFGLTSKHYIAPWDARGGGGGVVEFLRIEGDHWLLYIEL